MRLVVWFAVLGACGKASGPPALDQVEARWQAIAPACREMGVSHSMMGHWCTGAASITYWVDDGALEGVELVVDHSTPEQAMALAHRAFDGFIDDAAFPGIEVRFARAAPAFQQGNVHVSATRDGTRFDINLRW